MTTQAFPRYALAFTIGVLFAATACAPALGQQQQDFSKVEVKTLKLADDFYALEGAGGTISVLTGPDGVLLVDSQFAPLTGKLVAAIRQLSDKPIRFLIDTHVHGDHTGGNENFANLGATIFSRAQLRARLVQPNPAANGTPGIPAPAQALPIVTYDNAVTLHLNGEVVELLPIRKAHTDGDTLVRFAAHDILATGDYFRSVGYPNIDIANGGSLKGLLDGLAQTIALAGPNTRVIPGHGPITDRAALIAHRQLIDEVLASKPTAEFDSRVPQSAQTTERFVKGLYAELKSAR